VPPVRVLGSLEDAWEALFYPLNTPARCFDWIQDDFPYSTSLLCLLCSGSLLQACFSLIEDSRRPVASNVDTQDFKTVGYWSYVRIVPRAMDRMKVPGRQALIPKFFAHTKNVVIDSPEKDSFSLPHS